MTDKNRRAVVALGPFMRRLFAHLELRGAVAILSDNVIPLRAVTLAELAEAVKAAGLPMPAGGIAHLHAVLFGEPPMETIQ